MNFKRFPLLFLIFLLFVAFVRYWSLAYMAYDVSMYMVAARLMLNGARPYIEIVDINPPLILYIHVLIVWIAKILKSPPLELYDLSLLLANIGIAAFIPRTLKKLKDGASYAAIGFLAASLHALIAFQYGQREHLFMTAFILYFCLRWADEPKNKVLFYLITIATGLLAFLKPGFLAILITYELYLFFYRKKILLGHWIILSIPGLIYLAHFIFLPAEVNRAFWVELVPIVLSRYQTMGLSFSELIDFWGFTLLGYGTLSTLYVVIGLKTKDQKFAILSPIGICSIVAMFSALHQQKGWEYHLIPVQFMLFFGLPIALQALHQYISARFKLAAIGLFLLFLAGQHLYVLADKVYDNENLFSEVCGNNDLRKLAPSGSSIVIFSIHPCFSYPLFYERNYTPGTRYVSLFPLAFFNFTQERLRMFKYTFPTPKDLSNEEIIFVDNLKKDLEKNKPTYIIFPKNLVPEGFDPFRYAVSTGIFSEDTVNYKKIRDTSRWRIYKLRSTP